MDLIVNPKANQRVNPMNLRTRTRTVKRKRRGRKIQNPAQKKIQNKTMIKKVKMRTKKETSQIPQLITKHKYLLHSFSH